MNTRRITAGFVVASLIASLGVLLLRADDVDQTAKPTTDPTATSTDEPTPGSSQSTSTTAACDPEAAGDPDPVLIDGESLDDAAVVRGDAQLSVDTEAPHEGAGALRVATRATPAVVRATFDAPVDVQTRIVSLWLRQNGNVFAGGLDWSVRLHSDGKNAFEYILQPVDVTAAMQQWCLLDLDIGSMRIIGRPDPSRIRWLEVSVPAGARSAGQPRSNVVVWLDEIRA